MRLLTVNASAVSSGYWIWTANFFRDAAVKVSSLASAQKLNSAVYQTPLIPLA